MSFITLMWGLRRKMCCRQWYR